ncbi:MAG TPA: c-type cytochrome [Terriglobales bacterium]|nr:c-type cytochrome [Terriglobales bacterium]
MRTFRKVLLVTVILIVAVLAAAITLTIGWRPFIGPKTRALTSSQFERTPRRVERGRYIFNNLAGCVDCHSEHDPSKPGAPVIAGMEGAGEVMPFDDLPGRVVAPNITPDPQTGSGSWTDDQLARAIREGIGHDGRTLFPMMPYSMYRHMSDEDLASVVVYIRSLPTVAHPLPKSEIIFPVKYLVRSAPQPIESAVNSPDPSNRVEWGRYLATMASCADCHTPRHQGRPIPGMEFSGGNFMKGAWGSAATANLTPDPSGISYYDEALFIKAIRTGYVGARPLSPIMPFEFYRGLTDDDLKAIYAYLRTLKPVKHTVDNSDPATYCKLCRNTHGGGNMN